MNEGHRESMASQLPCRYRVLGRGWGFFKALKSAPGVLPDSGAAGVRGASVNRNSIAHYV